MRGTGKSATLDDSGLDDLARSFAAPGVDVLTMKDVLSGTDFVPLFMDTAHLNGRGHEIFARAIAEKITPIAKPPAR
jgi:lysophospholipase L1-like esterase